MATEVEKSADWIERRDEPQTEEAKSSILTKAGGAYIPPAKLRRMQEQLAQNKNSEEYQRLNWELLKKHIHGQINKVNVSNIVNVVRELLQKNVIRGMGLLAGSILKAQTFSPSFSHVYAALVAIINSKFPNIGQLILKRLVIQFKRAFRTNNKPLCATVSRFIAHLANQRVAHEIIILEILVLLMDKPTDDSIEIAITLLKECGEMLSRVIPKGLHSVFERLRSILEDADTIDTRTQQMIEIAMQVRKEKFKNYPAVIEELDLIDEEDQISHIIELSPEDGKPLDPETQLNYFKYDPEFEQNEEQYEEIRQKIIGDADDSDEEAEPEAAVEEEAPQETPQVQKIIDMTEQDMVAFRRNVYLAIQSSLDYQEAAHKLIKFHLKPGLDDEMCHMIVDCCAQQRTYERFYGLLAERFCRLRLEFQQSFQQIARDTYNTIHRFDIKKIRIMAQLIAHLLATDAIEWAVLSEIKMNENDTSSAGRVYVKILFQELAEAMGQKELFKKLYDPTISMHFEGLLPRDHPKNTRFAINFFTLCGLGGLTIILREHYEKKMKNDANADNDSDSTTSSSSDDSSTDSSLSSSDSESEESEKEVGKKDKIRENPVEVKQEVLSDEENRVRNDRRRRDSNENRRESRSSPEPKRSRYDKLPENERRKRRDSPKERQVDRNRRRERSTEQRRRSKSPSEKRDSPKERQVDRNRRRERSPEQRRCDSPKERQVDRNKRRERSPEQRRRSPSPSPKRHTVKSRVEVVERRRERSPDEQKDRRRRNNSPPRKQAERSPVRKDSPVIQHRPQRDLSEERAIRRLRSKSPIAERRRRNSSSEKEGKKRDSTSSSSSSSSDSSASSRSSSASRKD